MKISSFSNPLVSFNPPPALPVGTKQQEWRSTYGRVFDHLKEFLFRNAGLNKIVSQPTVEQETVVKTEEAALPALLKDPAIIEPTPKPKLDLDRVLPFDPKVTLKKLDNGLTYYVRNHAYPSNQTASLRLIVRTGSNDEQAGQEGLAHFLEHLLFYETESFGKMDIKRFLESKGVVFGADQNAYTSYNETLLKLDIPLNEPELLDKALHILREMATKAKISDSSVEEERPIVLDEITNEEAVERYNKKRDAALFEGTPYPSHHPKGLEKTIRECTSEQIRAFYRRTYQPQNMALVAVGDFDPKQVEQLIHKHFGDLAPTGMPPLKHEFKPTERAETQYVCHADPEGTTSLLQVHYPLKMEEKGEEMTVENVLHSLINTLYHMMFNRRLQEIITDSESPPFAYAEGNKVELADNIHFYRLTLVANDGELPQAYKRLLIELKRAKEHGFLPEEFESAKKSLMGALEYFENERDKTSTKELAKSYVEHFSKGSPALDIEEVTQLKKELLESVQLPHINLWNKILTSKPSSVVSTIVPQSLAETVGPEILKKVGEEAAAEVTSPYINTFTDRPLLRKEPQAGK